MTPIDPVRAIVAIGLSVTLHTLAMSSKVLAMPPTGPSPAPALKIEGDFVASKVYSGKETIWGFDFVSTTEMILTEKSGAVALLNLKTGQRTEILGGPKPVVNGQGGLLDVKLRREGSGARLKVFAYFTSTVAPEKGDAESKAKVQTAALFRAELQKSGDAYALKNLTRLFEAEPALDSGYHFGSRIAFSNEGGIFISLGERNQRERAQDLTQHWGKVLHLQLDGKPFATNPFIKGEKVGAVVPKPEIYSLGHRNPQGLATHPKTNQLFETEHGPRGGDEINKIERAKNYGWPVITYGREYWGPGIGPSAKPGFEQPAKYYVPSIAPSGLLIYSGKLHRVLEGKFLQGALVLKHLNVTDIETGAELRLFASLEERIRNVGESPAGEIYFSTDSGNVFKVAKRNP